MAVQVGSGCRVAVTGAEPWVKAHAVWPVSDYGLWLGDRITDSTQPSFALWSPAQFTLQAAAAQRCLEHFCSESAPCNASVLGTGEGHTESGRRFNRVE